MNDLIAIIENIITAFRSTFTAAGPAGKIVFASLTLLALCCVCSMPLALIMQDPEPEPAASDSRTKEIALDEEAEPTAEPEKASMQEPQATYTDQPTYPPQATHTQLPTYTPNPTDTPLPTTMDTPTATQAPTKTPFPTNTPAPTNTPIPVATATPAPPTSPPPTATTEGEQFGVVTSVVDGDTMHILIDGQDYSVRLIGINAPNYNAECGPESAASLSNLVQGVRVRLVKDVSDVDPFDRLLRYVYSGNIFVNAEMVRRGYAHPVRYPPDTAQADYLDSQAAGAPIPSCRQIFTPFPTAPPADQVVQPAPAEPAAPSGGEPAPQPEQPAGPPAQVPAICTCSGVDLNCPDMVTHAAAQACFDYCQTMGRGDIYGFDRNNDGQACENLP